MTTDEAARIYLALGRLNRTLRREAPDAAVGHGALSALATLVQSGPMRLGALAEVEGVSPPSMTRIVGLLQDLGHLRRTRDPADGRAQVVEVTESGRELVAHGRTQRLRALTERISRLDAESRGRLLAAVETLEALSADAPAAH